MTAEIFRLEHDHTHLSRVVTELRQAARMIERGESDAAAREEFVSVLVALSDELFDHFAREEEGLFPYLAEQFPDMRDALRDFERAHDRICGAASRITAAASKGPDAIAQQVPWITSLFARFDAHYAEHARRESELLRTLHARLSDEQRAALSTILRGL